jgi:hypothetical protein
MKGDAKHFDKEGNLIIVKEEVVSEPEPNKESDSDDEEEDEETGTEVPDGIQAITETAEPEGVAVAGTITVTDTNEPDSDSDIEFIEEVPKKTPLVIGVKDMATEGRVDGIKVEPKSEPAPEEENPTPGTSTAGVLDTTNLGLIQAQLHQLTELVNQHLNKSDSTIREVHSGGVQAKRLPKEEPKDAGPPEEAESSDDDKE